MSTPLSPDNRMQYVLSRLGDSVRSQGDGWVACCPAHDDAHESLTVGWGDNAPGVILTNCHAGCGFDAILSALGLDYEDFFPPRTDLPPKKQGDKKSQPRTLDDMRAWSSTAAIYEYRDEFGNVPFVVRRHINEDGSKTFRQYRSVGGGKFVSGTKGLRKLLFHLPELIEAVKWGRAIYIPEGEKDVLRLELLGLAATCNVGGAKKWPEDASGYFRGADVVILEDNDAAGREHALQVAHYLAPVASSIKIVRLPGLPEHGDVSDWLDAGHTLDELQAIVADAPPWERPSPAAVEFHHTDWGNAQRMIALYGDRIRYCKPFKSWHIWDSKRWARDRTSQIMTFCKATVREMHAQAQKVDGLTDRRLVEWALKSESQGKLVAMATSAETEPGVPILPEQMDADPWLLNVANGVLDLRAGVLSKHDATQLHTKLANVPYVADAKCPMWEAMLNVIMDNRPHLVSYIQRFLGYCLTGITREDVLMIAHGSGANGKSTVLGVFRQLMGDYAKQASFSTFEVHQNDKVRDDIADLKGARMVCAGEGDKGARLAEAMVKSLTGGDPVKARHLFQELFEFTPEFKVILASNHKPIIRGTDRGIWRRIRLVPFEVTIPDEKQDKDLPDKLRAHELPGILAWAVRGCIEWQRIGLADPPEVLHATEDYREEMDKLAPFFSDFCVTGPEHTSMVDDLYQAYARWAKGGSEDVMPRNVFGKRLAERGFRPARKTVGNTVHRMWTGVALKGKSEQPEPVQQGNLFANLPPKPGPAACEVETYSV